MHNENDEIDVAKIKSNDLKYTFSVFHWYLTNHLFSNKGNDKYYSQYECDSNQTTYEALMHIGAISIRAKSYEEAMVLNIILRTIIDGYCGGMLFAIEDEDENEPIDNKTLKMFFEVIEKSDSMSFYKNYKRYTPFKKKFNKHGGVDVSSVGIGKIMLQLPESKFYTRQVIMDLVSADSSLLNNIFNDYVERITFISRWLNFVLYFKYFFL